MNMKAGYIGATHLSAAIADAAGRGGQPGGRKSRLERSGGGFERRPIEVRGGAKSGKPELAF